MLKEFRDFLTRGNIVELAVAVIMGAAFGAVIKSLVDNVMMPLIAAIFGKPDFGSIAIDIGKGHIAIGLFLNDLVSFMLVAAAVFFFIVRPINAITARRKAHPEEAPAPPEDIVLLTEIRDLLKRG